MRSRITKYGTRDLGCLTLLLFGFSLTVTICNTLEIANYQSNLATKIIWAVPGKDVELPCDVTPPKPSDSVKMVFWYKDSAGMPLYSLDARGGPLSKANHWAMSSGIGLRAYFIADDHPSKTRLRIQDVNTDDEGIFRCRVDFINSPTRNFQVNLTLVVQPSFPRVFDTEGKEVIYDAGPFLEGRELFLSCQVSGGRPRPTVTWWHNGTLLDGVVDSSPDAYTTVNQLLITNLSRSFWGNNIECRASSSDVADDLIKTVHAKVYLKPNKVKIVSPNELLSVNKMHTVRCETSGSFPPAKISWFLNGKSIKSDSLTEETTEYFTSSILILEVEAEDDGKDLVCRADNPRYPGGSTEDRRQINVAYPPRVAVKPDDRLAFPVREGVNVELKCDTTARPAPHTIRWYHDGHLVQYNETAGIEPIEDILRLRKTAKNNDGQFSCAATNTEGETYSAPFMLTIQYAPRCAKGFEVLRVGVLPQEDILIDCHVDAVPEVTRFSWTYNTSKGVLPVHGARMQNEGGVSTLQFTPGTTNLESLACWATNSVGKQEKPCLFIIVPARNPEPPRNCVLKNATGGGGIEVACMAGEDGGLPQSFVLEVSDNSVSVEPPSVTTLSDQGERNLPLYRVLGDIPVFRLQRLEPGREYQLSVYAVNAKGRSEPPVVLSKVQVEVPLDIHQENAATVAQGVPAESSPPAGQSLTLVLLGLTAVAAVLMVGIISVATVLACRKKPSANVTVRRREPSRHKPSEDYELSEAGFNEGFHRRSAQYRASLYEQEMSRNSGQVTGPDLLLTPASFSAQSCEY